MVQGFAQGFRVIGAYPVDAQISQACEYFGSLLVPADDAPALGTYRLQPFPGEELVGTPGLFPARMYEIRTR